MDFLYTLYTYDIAEQRVWLCALLCDIDSGNGLIPIQAMDRLLKLWQISWLRHLCNVSKVLAVQSWNYLR